MHIYSLTGAGHKPLDRLKIREGLPDGAVPEKGEGMRSTAAVEGCWVRPREEE